MNVIDRRALEVLLAVLDIDKRDLAELMGYRARYVNNVLGGFSKASPAFREAFGAAVAELILGPAPERSRTYPAGPLAELLQRRAAAAACKDEFFADLGIAKHGWNKRAVVTEELVDRICCALGVHPSSIYGAEYDVEAAS